MCEDPWPHAWSICASCCVLCFPVTCNPSRAVTSPNAAWDPDKRCWVLVTDADDEEEEDEGGVGGDWESRQLAYAEAYSRHAAGTSPFVHSLMVASNYGTYLNFPFDHLIYSLHRCQPGYFTLSHLIDPRHCVAKSFEWTRHKPSNLDMLPAQAYTLHPTPSTLNPQP